MPQPQPPHAEYGGGAAGAHPTTQRDIFSVTSPYSVGGGLLQRSSTRGSSPRNFKLLVQLPPGPMKRRVDISSSTLERFKSQVRHGAGVMDDDRIQLAVRDIFSGQFVAVTSLAQVPDKAELQLSSSAMALEPLSWRECKAEPDSPDSPACVSVVAAPNRKRPAPLALETHASETAIEAMAAALGSPTEEIKMRTGTWSQQEQAAFAQGLHRFGKNWKMVASLVQTRSLPQIRRCERATRHPNTH